MKKQTTGVKIITGFFFLFLSVQAPAQVCTGGLGDIVWRQTFGKGTNPGPALPQSCTNFLYTSDPCPAEGYYTMRNTIKGCSWWNVGTCCTTGDGDTGYVMLVNAAGHPGDVYIDTIKNLCGKNSYQLEFTALNLVLASSCGGRPAQPSLAVTITDLAGTLLSVFNTGSIFQSSIGPGPVVFGFNFYIPAGMNSAVIRFTDNTTGSCGNIFAMDNIFVSTCGPTIRAAIKDKLGTFLDVCAGDPSPINLVSTIGNSNYTDVAYQWQKYNGTGWIDIPGATAPEYTLTAGTAAGAYKYRVTVAERDNIASSRCRVASEFITINVHNPITAATAASNSPVCVNSLLNLTATGGQSFQWTGPGGFISAEAFPAFIATNTSAGQYSVVVTDAYGCKSSAATIVSLIPAPNAMVSNTQNICLGDSVALDASGGVTYTWLPVNYLSNAAISNPVAKPVTTTTYTVTVTDVNHCTDTATVAVIVNTKPGISAGEDKVIIKGQSVILDGSIKEPGNINFNWLTSSSINDVHSLTPVVNPIINTDYVLIATSGIGCGVSTDTVSVIVYNDLYIPNAFSPNGDGLNDTWNIPALRAFPNSVATVYNRYGNKIFETSGGKKEWDGVYKNSPQPAGAYVYVIDLKNDRPVLKGTVMIIR